MPAVQLVVFDMAGTTVHDDDSVNRCIRDALRAVGLVVAPATVNAVMGLPKPEALAVLVRQHGREADLIDRLEAIHRDFVARSIAFYQDDPSVRAVAGAAPVFQVLKRAGVRIALNTGFNRPITRVILDRLGWSSSSLIDATISSDEVPRGRPHPDMIRELMGRLNVDDPRRVAKVGDTPADLEEGSNAGCGWIIGVTSGTHTRDELALCPHTHLVETLAEIPGVLGLVGDP
ncbi:MAG TPA: HAD family hydrolase [Isosphaeraceae bacterium]|nr:HAD family hydrolase [Isosphaeraceae bacterium]